VNCYRITVLVGWSALVGICLVALLAPHEPKWDGQSLSCWLQIGYGVGMTHGETDKDDADAAIRHIGTDALPILVRELGARLVQLLQKQSIISVSYRYPDERRRRAVGAFEALRGVAAPVLPQIRLYLGDPELQADAQSAIDAILAIDAGERYDDGRDDAGEPAGRDEPPAR
jgi:hypothetical protein